VPRIEASALSLILRLSLLRERAWRAHAASALRRPAADLRCAAVVTREGTVQVTWNERSVTLADGEVLQLRTPQIRITGLAFDRWVRTS